MIRNLSITVNIKFCVVLLNLIFLFIEKKLKFIVQIALKTKFCLCLLHFRGFQTRSLD